MKTKAVKKSLLKTFQLRKYNNIIEASCLSKFMRRFSGTAVYVLESTPGDRIVKKFSYFGFVCFLFDFCVYFYCTYKAHVEDQTIVRTIYTTKLRRYGDDVERISSIIFVVLAMWKVPFSITGACDLWQQIVDIDNAIERMGEIINHNKNALYGLIFTLGQFIEYSARLACIWVALMSLNIKVPIEKLYQIVFTDALSLVLVSHYCFSLCVLRDRYKYLNKILAEVQERRARECRVFTRTKIAVDVNKVERLQDKNVCEKINSCAKVYAMLYRATDKVNILFGTGLVLTMMVYLLCIILYMFYFMEATASGLFMDLRRYLDFMICVFWQIAHAISIIFAIVYFSESTVSEAKKVALVTHGIIQNDIGSDVNKKAMQLSLQILHQTPKFTPNGLVELNFALLYDGARSVFTYLIIVLQFVTDS